MKNAMSKAIVGLVLTISLSAMVAPVWVSGHGGGGRIDGTWDVQVTIRNCSDGVEIRSFKSLTTFMSGGTLVDSTSGIPQAQRTPGQGVWSHVSGNIYSFSFKSFNFNAVGNFTGWTTIIHEVSLDSSGDEYTSAGTSKIYDANGNFLFGGCSTTTATRFE